MAKSINKAKRSEVLEIRIAPKKEKYDGVNLLILLNELFPQREILEFPNINPVSYEGLIRWLKFHEQKNSLDFGKFQEQLYRHAEVLQIMNSLDELENYFSNEDKSPEWLQIRTELRNIAKNFEGIGSLEIEKFSNYREKIGTYRRLYNFLRTIDENSSLLGVEITKKIYQTVRKSLRDGKITEQYIDDFLISLEGYKHIYSLSKKAFDDHTDIKGVIGPFESITRQSEPYKTFFSYLSVFYTHHIFKSTRLWEIKEKGDLEKAFGSLHSQSLSISKKDFIDIINKAYQSTEMDIGEIKFTNLIEFSLSDTKFIFEPLSGEFSYPKKNPQEKLKNHRLDLLFAHHSFPRKIEKTYNSQNGYLPSTNNDFLSLQNSIVQDIQDKKIDQAYFIESLKANLIPGNKESLQLVQYFYKRGVISSDQAYMLLEGEKGFQRPGISLSNMMEVFGLSLTLKEAFSGITGKTIDANSEKNIVRFFRYLLFLESSGGYNVGNYEGKSSAKGYTQYLEGNGEWKKGKRQWSSFDMGLRSIPENIRTQYLGLTKNYNNIKNPQKQSVLSLSSSEQLILCFADLWRKDTARMEQIVFQDQYTLIPKVYAESHHTDPDTPTRIKMKVAYGKFIYGIS